MGSERIVLNLVLLSVVTKHTEEGRLEFLTDVEPREARITLRFRCPHLWGIERALADEAVSTSRLHAWGNTLHLHGAGAGLFLWRAVCLVVVPASRILSRTRILLLGVESSHETGQAKTRGLVGGLLVQDIDVLLSLSFFELLISKNVVSLRILIQILRLLSRHNLAGRCLFGLTLGFKTRDYLC